MVRGRWLNLYREERMQWFSLTLVNKLISQFPRDQDKTPSPSVLMRSSIDLPPILGLLHTRSIRPLISRSGTRLFISLSIDTQRIFDSPQYAYNIPRATRDDSLPTSEATTPFMESKRAPRGPDRAADSSAKTDQGKRVRVPRDE
ncbi:hypothetical protein EVAR_31626_1 [Eumeta japonica]|uniref:Uncharacterized protein n=1 Tax=Eumeta variegata TaxID=151549 RepID=A0A4C1W0V0_EUMVA|nr:hypothetical protein EVAR_31626_1 [Eumeta japonica]